MPTPPDPERQKIVGLRLFERVADRWHLDDSQRARLLGVSADDLKTVRSKAANDVSADMLARMAHVLAIHVALYQLLGEQGDGWVHRPNTGPGFSGRPVLERMLSGATEDLRYVRGYLEGQLYP